MELAFWENGAAKSGNMRSATFRKLLEKNRGKREHQICLRNGKYSSFQIELVEPRSTIPLFFYVSGSAKKPEYARNYLLVSFSNV